MKTIIGVDLGGTQVRALRTDTSGTKLERAQQQTHAQEGPEAVLDRILQTVREVLPEGEEGEVLGLGIGAPGPIDPQGVLHNPPNLPGWEGISITERLQKTYSMPVFAGNDANVAALGEHRFGAGRGVEDLIYITISTGIGGGIISRGRLLVGSGGFAGEVGHQTLVIDGPECGCGQRGHLEALASGPAIAREARLAIEGGAASAIMDSLDSPWEITAERVSEAAQAGDPLARELLAQAGRYIGLGLLNLIHVLDPQRILLGGGVTQAGDLIFTPIRETVYNHLMSPVFQGVEVLPAELEEDVGLLGAVALVLQEMEGDHGA